MTSISTGAMSCPGATGRPGVSESPGAVGFPGVPESPGAIESPGAAGRPGPIGGSGATTGGLGFWEGVSAMTSGESGSACGCVAADTALLSTAPTCVNELSTAVPTASSPTTAPSTSSPTNRAYSIMDCPESWRKRSKSIFFVPLLQLFTISLPAPFGRPLKFGCFSALSISRFTVY